MKTSRRLLQSSGLLSFISLVLLGGCEATPIATPTSDAIGEVSQRLGVQAFQAGSLVIPMDNDYQDQGTLKAFGLVYALLRAGVPVNWVISQTKAQGGVDFTATGKDLKTSAVVTNHGYRGGPFVVDAADRTAALTVISAWQTANPTTAVHDMTATFSGDVRKTLAAAPRIAVFVDGNEDIAFSYLRAAGITDSTGQAWPAAKQASYTGYPDVLTPAQIAGTTTTGAPDGALFHADGTPAYCQLTSMHYAPPVNDEVVREVRAWLNNSSLTHSFMECRATLTFENSTNGHFLTTNGLADDGAAPVLVANRHPESSFAQYDGVFTPVTGQVDSIGLATGSAFRSTDVVLVNRSVSPTTSRIVWMTGFLDGDPTKGKVSYLAGHQYTTDVPISANTETNGVRLFLNSLFESQCADAVAQPTVTFAKTAPASVSGSTVTYTLSYSNTGPGVADSVVVKDPLPTGTTFASATNGGTAAGGFVTWNLGNIAAGQSGTVGFTVNVAADGTYTNQAELDYLVSTTPKKLLSNTVSTTRTTAVTPADLSLTATDAPDPVAAGGSITYTVNVSNGGPGTAAAPTAHLAIPAGATYVGFTGTGWTCTATAGIVNCTRGAVASGATPTLTITLTAPNAAATLTTVVSVDSTTPDSNTANNGATLTTTVNGPVVDAGADSAVDSGVDGGSDAGDGGALDSDGDGLPDSVEIALGTDPFDADSDDDGVPDGAEIAFGTDSDGDGLINALDPDSDNDGLFDGTELGLDCSNPATNVRRGRCVADADKGATKTNPIVKDTDGGGVSDGSEDANLNGKVDTGETDPTAGHGSDDSSVVDTDSDGLSDALEKFLGSNPNDADSDDDGALDGQEANPSDDNDLDGLIDVLDADSDNDALYDGTEMGFSCSNPATDTTRNRCIADGDLGTTKTSPLLRDTDNGGASDGSEDWNRNGVVDNGEQNPTVGHAADDDQVVDTDNDGLSDALETAIGSNPNDADSDDDGLLDGSEPNPTIDQDGDNLIDILDPDSDGDGLYDGTEAGNDCGEAGTDATKGVCTADADPTTTTAVLNPDTDHGGVKDGVEDTNHNGKVDTGERDPNNPLDDNGNLGACASDTDCGTSTSGKVCVNTTCVAGCRGTGGNGCPTGQVCSSKTSDVGTCSGTAADAGPVVGADASADASVGADASVPNADGGTLADDGSLGGGGCNCAVALGADSSSSRTAGTAGLVALGAALMGLGRRRARRRHDRR